MTKHHAIEIVSASILAGILSISAVRLEAVPESATPFSRFVQAGYYNPPACPQDYHYACRPGGPNNGYKKYCACWPTWPDWVYSPYGPYR